MTQRLTNFGGGALTGNQFAQQGQGLIGPLQTQLEIKHDPSSVFRAMISDPNVLPDEIILGIVQLRYQLDGTPIFKADDPNTTMEIFSLLQKHGAVDAYKILVEASKHEEKIPWSLPTIIPTIKNAEHQYKLGRSKKTGIKVDVPCRKCGKTEVTVVERQMRSPDEPASMFATCVGCGKTWRMQ